MPVLRRTAVDGKAFERFSEWALDFEGTERRLLARVDDRLGEVDQLVAEAQRALASVQAGRDRIDRDYTAGDLEAQHFARLSANLDEELLAAQAQLKRLSLQRDELASVAPMLGETAFVQRFHQLVLAVGGRVRDAAALQALLVAANAGMPVDKTDAGQEQALIDIAPLRAAIERVFSESTVNVRAVNEANGTTLDWIRWLRKDGEAYVGSGEPGFVIELAIALRPEVLAHIDVDESGPRVPLHLDAEQPTRDGGAV